MGKLCLLPFAFCLTLVPARSSALFHTHCTAEGWPAAQGEWAVFLRPEAGTDLNGDGDSDDLVLQAVDVANLQVHNLGLAVDPALAARREAPPYALTGTTLAILVSEAAQGSQDLNHNGTASDNVLALVDLAHLPPPATPPNLQFAIRNSQFAISGSNPPTALPAIEVHATPTHLALLAPLANQPPASVPSVLEPAGVLEVFDLKTRELWNSGIIAAAGIAVAGEWAAVLTPELAAGKDLNGDGDRDDAVAQLVNLATHQVINTRLASAAPLALTERLLAVAVDEADQGERDLDGNGRVGDVVLHVVELAGGETINTRQQVGEPVAADGTLVAFPVEEESVNQDLNGDGDRDDAVAHLWDLTTRRAANLREDASGGLAVSAGRVAFLTDEASQRNHDLNGDGDTEDMVLQVYDSSRRTIANLRQAVREVFRLTPDHLAFLVNEADQGNRDLNRNGTTDDDVLALHTFAANTTVSTARAASGPLALSDRALLFFSPDSGPLQGDVCELFRIR